ncbi:MAG TPA: glycosyltransferase [Rhizomicrobium sp.]
MLGSGFGGLEKLFLDEIEMLSELGACGVVRRNSALAHYARERNVAFEQIRVFSDWDPFSLAAARAVADRRRPRLVLCVGRKAHRLFGRVLGNSVPIVVMVQKRRFDVNFPYAGVLVAAEHRRETLIQDGVRPDDIAAVPNAVRLPPDAKSEFALRRGEPAHIGALGRLHPKKGFGMLVEALRLLAERGVLFRCTIAGEGPERGRLVAQVREYGLADRVFLPGWTDDVPAFLSAVDVFVLPSFQEDYPLAVLDAMASGVPIIASAIEGPKDFLREGTTGLFVPPGNASALADTLTELLASPALRESLGHAARLDAEQRYSFRAIGRSLTTALENVMDGRSITGSAAPPM